MAIGVGLLVAWLALVAVPAAHAANEYELNDSRDSAYGPLEGGKSYTASIETENDVDWYLFYVKTYSQLDFSASMVKEPGCRAYFRLSDKDGKFLNDFVAGYLDETNHLYLTLTPGRYYLEVGSCDPGDRYRFRIDPGASITSSRDCGEAIVARDAISPQLAEVVEEIGENTAELTVAVQAVKGAKRTLAKINRRWRRTLRRLARRGKATPYRKRRVRSRFAPAKRRVISRLREAKQARSAVLVERIGLQTLGAQHTTALNQAEGTIAAKC